MMGSPESACALAIDGGRSGVRVAAVRDGRCHLVRSGPGLPLLAGPDGPRQVALAITAQLRGGPPIAALAAGLTGLAEALDRVPDLLQELHQRTGASQVVLASDVVSSHLGALGGRAGVVAAAGTGTVVLALRRDGRHAKVDGWGYLLGDAGSGYDIGRRGLIAALACYDGRSDAEELRAAAGHRFGRLDELSAQLFASASPAREIASFAPDVTALAREGDAHARTILDGAVTALALAIEAAAERAELDGFERIWSWAGSILAVEDLVRGPLERRLGSSERPLQAVRPFGGSLDGAARLLEPAVRDRLGSLVHTTADR